MNYFQIPALSNSALSTFSYDPSYYHKVYVTKEIEEKKESAALTLGSLVHCLILEADKFDERYVISKLKPEDKPTSMMLDFVNTLLKYEVYDELALDAAYAASGYKISKDKVVENFNKSFKSYYDEQVACKGKTLITQAEYDTACKARDVAMNNPQWTKILKDDEWETFNELEILWQYDELLPCKSKVDMLKVRVVEDSIFIKIFDIKTDSQKPVHKYIESFEFWKTYRQMAFYREAVLSWVFEKYGTHFKSIIVSPYIVAIDVVRFKSLIYFVDYSYVSKGLLEVRQAIKDLKWHLREDLWEYPKSVYDALLMGEQLNLIDESYYERASLETQRVSSSV